VGTFVTLASAGRGVAAAGSGPDGGVQVSGGVRRAVADPQDRGADGPGDVEPRPFGFRAEPSRPPAEPGRGGELAGQAVTRGAEPAAPLGVMPLFGLGQLLLQAGEAVPVGGPGLLVEDLIGRGRGQVAQAVGVTGQAGAGSAGGGRELDEFQGGQLTAGV